MPDDVAHCLRYRPNFIRDFKRFVGTNAAQPIGLST